MSDLSAGDRVRWKSRGVIRDGTIIAVTDRTAYDYYAHVKADSGKSYRVRKSKLAKLEHLSAASVPTVHGETA